MEITEYKQKHGLDTQEKLLRHIDELKRNTVVNQELVNDLVDDFFAGEKSRTNSTRHKSRSGETHTVDSIPAGLKDVSRVVELKKEQPLEFPQLKSSSWSDLTNLDDTDLFNILSPNEVTYYNTNPLKDFSTVNNSSVGVKEAQTTKKAPIFTFCKQMKNAIEQLALRSEYGHNKYIEYDADWNNFARVENGNEEYGNSEFRHALEIGEDSELEHYVASAWNSIARLEIYLRKNLQESK